MQHSVSIPTLTHGITAVVAAAGMMLAGPAQAASIVNTFDLDAQSWTGIPGEGALSHAPTGGAPGGHIRITDIGVGGPLGSGAVAGSDFSGDLSEFDGGSLSLDMATFAGGGGTFAIFGTVRITGGGLEAFFDLADTAPGAGVWTAYSAPFIASAWATSDAEWAAILGDVVEIAISTDAFDGADTIGIDNVVLRSAPSVLGGPATLAMLLAGVAMMATVASPRRCARQGLRA